MLLADCCNFYSLQANVRQICKQGSENYETNVVNIANVAYYIEGDTCIEHN